MIFFWQALSLGSVWARSLLTGEVKPYTRKTLQPLAGAILILDIHIALTLNKCHLFLNLWY